MSGRARRGGRRERCICGPNNDPCSFCRERAARGPEAVQYRDDDVTVRVRSGYSRDHDSVTSDFIIAPDGSDEHKHLGISEEGDTLFDKWNPNH